MILDDLAALIESEGLGTVGADVIKSRLPEKPIECVALLDEEGASPTYAQNSTAVDWESPHVQVVVRSEDYDVAKTRAQAIADVLGAVSNEVVGAARYLRVVLLNSPFQLDVDDSELVQVGFNLEARKAPG